MALGMVRNSQGLLTHRESCTSRDGINIISDLDAVGYRSCYDGLPKVFPITVSLDEFAKWLTEIWLMAAEKVAAKFLISPGRNDFGETS